MNETDFIKKKKEEQYSFTIESVDGTHVSKTNDLQKFADEWLNGNLSKGRMYTNFGDVIYPTDTKTEKAVKEKIEIEYNEIHLAYTANNKEILSAATGLDTLELARLMVDKENNSTTSYIETSVGRVFLIAEDDALYSKFVHTDKYLKEVGMPEGSMTLQDVSILKDDINNLTIVVDLRKEAVELEDMVSRSLTKNKTLDILEYYVDDMGDREDYIPIKSRLMASDIQVDKVHSSVKNLEDICEHMGTGLSFTQNGFCNSIDNPINHYSLENVIKNISVDRVTVASKDKEIEEKSSFDAVLITKKMISAFGSKTKEFYMEDKDGFVSKLKEGDLLKIEYSNGYRSTYKPIDNKYMEENNLRVLSKNESNKYKYF